jgi:hypothetical protein
MPIHNPLLGPIPSFSQLTWPATNQAEKHKKQKKREKHPAKSKKEKSKRRPPYCPF